MSGSNCLGLKKGGLFITIMDLVVFLILIIAITMIPGSFEGTP